MGTWRVRARVEGVGLRVEGFRVRARVFLKEFSVRDLRGVLHRAFHRDQQGLELRVLEFVEYRCAMSHAQKNLSRQTASSDPWAGDCLVRLGACKHTFADP